MSADERDEHVVDPDGEQEVDLPDDVPEWEDEYLDRVGANLMFNFDLEKDFRVEGEMFDLYGQLRMDSHKQFLTSALSYGHQKERHHLFARRVGGTGASVRDLERLVDLGHDIADDWIDANEEHYGTEFTFVLVAPEVTDEVRSFVSSFKERKLLKYGYYGEYRIHLAVVAPDEEDLVASPEAHVATAFRLWEPASEEKAGLFDRLKRLF